MKHVFRRDALLASSGNSRRRACHELSAFENNLSSGHVPIKMNRYWKTSVVILAFYFVLLFGTAPGWGESAGLVVAGKITTSRWLANGIEVRSGGMVFRVTALRDDVIRVRGAAAAELPEDASWAVLPEARTSAAAVAKEEDKETVGFATKKLHVRLNRSNAELRITDLNGRVVEEDVVERPVEFHGCAFRVYKSMPPEEHFFGLGDKPGPLDRRGGTFSMWNTDWFGFQESTDTIYKSIPFFMSLNKGLASGTLFDNHWRSSFDFGRELHTAYSFGSENGPLDYYVIYGPEPKQVLEGYAWLTGTAAALEPRISAVSVQLRSGDAGAGDCGSTSQRQDSFRRDLPGY
jgi:hypothetical protein